MHKTSVRNQETVTSTTRVLVLGNQFPFHKPHRGIQPTMETNEMQVVSPDLVIIFSSEIIRPEENRLAGNCLLSAYRQSVQMVA